MRSPAGTLLPPPTDMSRHACTSARRGIFSLGHLCVAAQGTKVACGEGGCGACAVEVSRLDANSGCCSCLLCTRPAWSLGLRVQCSVPWRLSSAFHSHSSTLRAIGWH